MAITGPASYLPTMNEFTAHWAQCNAALGPQPLVVRRPDNNTAVTREQFTGLGAQLRHRQQNVQGLLMDQTIARGEIDLKKNALLKFLNLFINVLNGYYINTEFEEARPYAPSITDGQEAFLRPMLDAVNLWTEMNEGPAPAGVTLPLILRDDTTQEDFAGKVAALEAAYREEQRSALHVSLGRGRRNLLQRAAYEILKAYREAVPGICVEFPALVNTLPRLTPLPGHTPAPVPAQAVFEAPDQARILYELSAEPAIKSYQLRGNIGEKYDGQDAVVLATHEPNDAREFVTNFGLSQPGAQVALKVFVILETGNEAGGQAMVVTRPANEPLPAA
ncbi:MAG TPA: hypothetical protein VGF13_17070 [Verrucomicrobiae bacterium]|jgi:hypothetical protein